MLENLEICKFKDYEDINLINLKNIFNLFDECLNILEENNIEYIVTGSFALILISNKIYRNIKDIDFLVREPFFQKEMSLFLNKNFFHVSTTFKCTVFEKKQTRIEFHTPVMLIDDVLVQNSKKISYKNYLIDCSSMENNFFSKQTLYDPKAPSRKKDYDDMEFYKGY
jgi:hypothetical protein